MSWIGQCMLEVKIVGYDFAGVVKWWMKVAERGHVGQYEVTSHL